MVRTAPAVEFVQDLVPNWRLFAVFRGSVPQVRVADNPYPDDCKQDPM